MVYIFFKNQYFVWFHQDFWLEKKCYSNFGEIEKKNAVADVTSSKKAS